MSDSATLHDSPDDRWLTVKPHNSNRQTHRRVPDRIADFNSYGGPGTESIPRTPSASVLTPTPSLTPTSTPDADRYSHSRADCRDTCCPQKLNGSHATRTRRLHSA